MTADDLDRLIDLYEQTLAHPPAYAGTLYLDVHRERLAQYRAERARLVVVEDVPVARLAALAEATGAPLAVALLHLITAAA